MAIIAFSVCLDNNYINERGSFPNTEGGFSRRTIYSENTQKSLLYTTINRPPVPSYEAGLEKDITGPNDIPSLRDFDYSLE